MKIALKGSIAMVAILSLIACGGDASKKAPAAKKEVVKEVTKVEEVKEKKIVEITLAAQGEDMTAIAFEPKSLSIPAGSRVKLTFENKSQAAGMYHNFVLVKLGTGQEVATAGIQAGEANSFSYSSFTLPALQRRSTLWLPHLKAMDKRPLADSSVTQNMARGLQVRNLSNRSMPGCTSVLISVKKQLVG